MPKSNFQRDGMIRISRKRKVEFNIMHLSPEEHEYGMRLFKRPKVFWPLWSILLQRSPFHYSEWRRKK